MKKPGHLPTSISGLLARSDSTGSTSGVPLSSASSNQQSNTVTPTSAVANANKKYLAPTLSDPQHGAPTTTTQPKDTMPKEPTAVTNRFNKKKPSKPGQNILSSQHIGRVHVIYTIFFIMFGANNIQKL